MLSYSGEIINPEHPLPFRYTMAVILLTSLYLISLMVDCRADEDTFRSQCTRMCNSSANFTEFYRCSCSKSCIVYDDCCYDSPYKDNARSSEIGFGCMSVAGLGDFRAVTSCMPNWSTNSCSELLGFLPPVTSRITNITYGNVFCASCNDDGDNLVRWNVYLRCPKQNDPEDIGLEFTQIKYRWGKFWGRGVRESYWRPCKFYTHFNDFRILKSLELRPCVLPRKRSTCSETWSDISVEEKCRSYVDPVYVNNVSFRNAHCARCNNLNSSEIQCVPAYMRELLNEGAVDETYLRSCMATSDFIHRCVAELGKGKVYSLSMLFDVECLPPTGRLCCRGERYDDNTGRCRTVRRG